MGAGYTRQAQDNIVDGAVINSDDFNAEFNQLESAFNSTTGHTHDGTEGEGPKIDTGGLADDAVTPAKLDSSGTYEVAGLVVGGATLNSDNLEILDGATLSTAELNILDGATVTTSELNILDGATVEASELNILDGATITTTELNRLSGVTSNVQTQIDNIIAGTGGVTEVTAASPLSSSEGTTPEISLTGTVPIANGGTGQTGVPADGQLLIGNGTGFSRAGLTAGTGINITNGSGSITISADAASDVNLTTDVIGTLPVSNGGTGATSLSGVLKGNGTSAFTAGDVSLTSEVTGTLPVTSGGTGNSSHPNGEYLVGNGSSSIGSVSSIPSSDISGLGSMATQNSNSVSITGGSIDGGALDDDSVSTSKLAISLGSMAEQNANSVDINGGDVTGLSDFSVTGGEAVINPSNVSGRTLVVGDTSSDSSTWNASIKGQNGPYPALNVTSGIDSGSVGMEVVQQTVNGYLIFFSHPNSNTNIGGITVASSSTVAYNVSSDYRLKTNVTPMTGSVDRLNSLNPVRFQWKNELENPAVDGFLAHEVSPVVPEAIHGEKDAVNEDGSIKPQGIDQSKLVPLLVGAVQELSARVEQLEAQLNSP